jgi:acid phosphatase
VKKYLLILVALITIAFAPICSAGQKTASKQAPARRHQPVFSISPSGERIPNLDILKKEVKQYHDCTCKCGCYNHDIEVQADRAIAFLRRRTARQQAQGKPGAQEKLAMAFDIDETTLSNYSQMLKADFGYDSKVFDAWVQSAQAPAIPGSLRIYKKAQGLGVSVFFITGRHEDEREATERNLRAQGFENWQQLTMRPNSGGAQSASDYKSVARQQIVEQGYRIVLNVGDQWSDLKGKPEAELSVKYPDPFYFLP